VPTCAARTCRTPGSDNCELCNSDFTGGSSSALPRAPTLRCDPQWRQSAGASFSDGTHAGGAILLHCDLSGDLSGADLRQIDFGIQLGSPTWPTPTSASPWVRSISRGEGRRRLLVHTYLRNPASQPDLRVPSSRRATDQVTVGCDPGRARENIASVSHGSHRDGHLERGNLQYHGDDDAPAAATSRTGNLSNGEHRRHHLAARCAGANSRVRGCDGDDGFANFSQAVTRHPSYKENLR